MLNFMAGRQNLPGQAAEMNIGDTLKDLLLVDLNGNEQVKTLSGTKLLFVFSITCTACALNFDNWREIDTSIDKNLILYLSLDSLTSTTQYAVEKGIADRTFLLKNPQDQIRLKLARVPQTILVRDGKIEIISVGRLNKDKKDTIINTVNSHLGNSQVVEGSVGVSGILASCDRLKPHFLRGQKTKQSQPS